MQKISEILEIIDDKIREEEMKIEDLKNQNLYFHNSYGAGFDNGFIDGLIFIKDYIERKDED
jgi:hypothetical protein